MSSDWASTERVSAEITLADGTVLAGEIHVQPRVAHHEGAETPVEMLNRTEPFFVLSHEGGVLFLSKAQVAYVSCGAQPPLGDPERFNAAKLVALEVQLVGGAEFKGWATVERPPNRARTLDYLNEPEPFFTVWTNAVTCYIHRAHVRLVRPLD